MKNLLLLFLLGFGFLGIAQKNQNIEMSKIESGSYSVYKKVEKGYNKFVFEQAKKNWPVELFSDGDRYPKILIKKVGILDEFYEADLPGYPAYYLSKTSTIVITVIDKKIYYYTWTASKGATISYILSMGKPGKYIDEKTALDTYRRTIKKQQSGARESRITENAAIAEKEAEENTLKGKSIKSIKVKMIDAPEGIGMLTILSIGFEVELTNGKILKTKNLGGKTPYTDFETSVKGGDYSGGDFKIASDSRKIPNDKIEIQAWSKYDSKIKGNFSQVLNYKSNVNYQYQGRGGKNGRGSTSGRSPNGGDASDGRSINVTAEKYNVNGQTIVHIILSDAISGQILAEAKVNENNKITINVSGGKGGSGCSGNTSHSGDGGDGGNGGNGGTVYLSGSAASIVKLYVIKTGGTGGTGGSAKNSSYNSRGTKGSNGLSGSFIK